MTWNGFLEIERPCKPRVREIRQTWAAFNVLTVVAHVEVGIRIVPREIKVGLFLECFLIFLDRGFPRRIILVFIYVYFSPDKTKTKILWKGRERIKA